MPTLLRIDSDFGNQLKAAIDKFVVKSPVPFFVASAVNPALVRLLDAQSSRYCTQLREAS